MRNPTVIVLSPQFTEDRSRGLELATVDILYQAQREMVLRSVQAYARDADDAEEITQEAFLKLCQQYANGHTIEDPLSWLLTVSRRLVIDRFRRSRYEPLKGEALLNAATRDLADASPTPEQAAIIKAAAAELFQALASLKDIEKECYSLRSQGLPFREIGIKLNLSTSVAARHTERAIRRARSYLKSSRGGDRFLIARPR